MKLVKVRKKNQFFYNLLKSCLFLVLFVAYNCIDKDAYG